MFFTKAGGVVAWLAFVIGTLRVGSGLLVAQSDNYEALARRYLGSKTPGEAIDQGVMLLVFGIGLGVVVEISRSLRPPLD